MIGLDKNYEIKFKKGLNFISGPTSTGKTTILELIDYALGAKKHKSYIEIGKKCTDIELEIIIEETLYKIKRRLFDFNLPVLVSIFDDENKKFFEYNVFDIENSDNEKSLSTFLLLKLGLNGVKVSNQNLSFRDLFKYSYLKQIEIDNEDILASETNWILNNKRKATFEIIFNFYNQLLGELKASLKINQEEFNSEKIRYEGISDFLKTSKIENYESVKNKQNSINEQINELKQHLEKITQQSNVEIVNPQVKILNKSVRDRKQELEGLYEELNNQEQYIVKLRLLSNQYENDIEKLDASIMGIKEINKYEFLLCPNCLKPLEKHHGISDCLLCKDNLDEIIENTVLLKADKSNIAKKKNELEKHIIQEISRKETIQLEISSLANEISYDDRTLEELTEKYINPFIEEISFINMSLGKYYTELDDLDDSLRFIKELNRLSILLLDKEKEVNYLKEQIKDKNNLSDKSTAIHELTTRFENILKEFKFPKLEKAYINSSDYLPYVRERKYNDLGSLGAVTLITMAYYLSILVESTKKQYNHLNFLMIDTPRKNLGSSSKNEELFQDEEIYDSVIKYFMSLDKELSSKLQLIVVNNGYPSFLPKESIRIEFSSNGQIGLIDDI